jgi:hypothetical protein
MRRNFWEANMMRSLPSSAVPFAALASLLFLCAPTSASADGFTFAGAEYMGVGGLAAARAFVADALPPGLPMSRAIRRARSADAACRTENDGAFLCRYYTVVRPEAGDLGEDYWFLRLTPGPDGRLATADVWRRRIGMSGMWDNTKD